MKQILTASALSTLLLIGCSQESSDSSVSEPSPANNTISENIESITEEVKEVIDPSSLPQQQTGSFGLTEKGDEIIITGITMHQPHGIRMVEVQLNGEPAGIATYKIERQLHQTYNDFYDPNKPNVGFEYTIDTKKLAPGEYDVTIKATILNGKSFTFGHNKRFVVE